MDQRKVKFAAEAMRKKIVFAVVLMWAVVGSVKPDDFLARRYHVREIAIKNPDDHIYFSAPASLAYDRDFFYVLDGQSCEVRVFLKSGEFQYAFGRNGQAPGEFDMPSDIVLYKDKLFVSDTMNRRIQILDKRGNYLGGMKIPFSPKSMTVTDGERIIIASSIRNPEGPEKMVHGYDFHAKFLWKTFDSLFSGNSVYDSFQNQIYVRSHTNGEFFVVRRANDQAVYQFDENGKFIKKIKMPAGFPFKKISLPLRGGKKMPISSFCWHCALDNGRFFFLIPEYSDAGDLVAGKEVVIVGLDGKVEARADLPDRLKLISVDHPRIYGVDTEHKLRIFEFVEK